MEATKLAEGKTKIIWKDEIMPGHVVIESKDDITAGDGERRDVLEGKSVSATTTTVNCFKLLTRERIPNHFAGYLKEPRRNERAFVAQQVSMIPLEVVVRRVATGSYLKRQPEVEEGTVLPYTVEFFLKDDIQHDPLVILDTVSDRVFLFDPKQLLYKGMIDELPLHGFLSFDADKWPKLIGDLRELAINSFKVLEAAWQKLDVVLVDLKIECGHWSWGGPEFSPRLVVADVIDNDSWRIWPRGDKTQMMDKQVYRDSQNRTPAELNKIKENYAWVAEQTSKFLTL